MEQSSISIDSAGTGKTGHRDDIRADPRAADRSPEARGPHGSKVLGSIRSCRGALFVDEALASRAYEDTALPIGCGQTISPALCHHADERSAVAGGSSSERCSRSARIRLSDRHARGIRAAGLRRRASRAAPATRAHELLAELPVSNVSLRHGDGSPARAVRHPSRASSSGAPPRAPFPRLLQAAQQATIIIPISTHRSGSLLHRDHNGSEFINDLLTVGFMPFIRRTRLSRSRVRGPRKLGAFRTLRMSVDQPSRSHLPSAPLPTLGRPLLSKEAALHIVANLGSEGRGAPRRTKASRPSQSYTSWRRQTLYGVRSADLTNSIEHNLALRNGLRSPDIDPRRQHSARAPPPSRSQRFDPGSSTFSPTGSSR